MRAILLGAALLGVGLSSAGPAWGEARELFPNTPDEVVRERAAAQARPLWQVPLGPALVEDMVLLEPGRLLVSLRKDFPGLPNLDMLLVDTGSGSVLWRLAREKSEGEFDRLLILDDLLLFRVRQKQSVDLRAVDPRTGGERWRAGIPAKDVVFVPHPRAGCLLAVVAREGTVELAALGLADGAERWRRAFVVPAGESRPTPVPDGEDVLTCFDHLRRLSAADGTERFALPEVVFDEISPPPALQDGLVWAVDARSRLVAVDAGSGVLKLSAPLPAGPRYSQVYPLGGTIYLRGLSAATEHFVSAVDPRTAKVRWNHRLGEPSVSNLIEEGGTLWFGTPGSLVALATADGRQRWSAPVTTTGRAFPVRIRKAGGRVVYIGELAVAAFDAASGRMAWRHGLTPGAEELHLNGLDVAVPNLREELRRGRSGHAGHRLANRMLGFASSEALRYQGLASTYRAEMRSAESRGDAISYNKASLQRGFAEHEQRLQQWSALAIGVTHIALSIREIMQAGALRTHADRQVLFRKSILAAHAQAESEAFVHRPHLAWRDATDAFLSLAVVDLASGRRSDTPLSPHYLSYGLWQVVDFEKRVAYHVHIGMDPARYELGEGRAYHPYTRARTLGTFLIAQPITLPQ